jgi:hypothetical protein
MSEICVMKSLKQRKFQLLWRVIFMQEFLQLEFYNKMHLIKERFTKTEKKGLWREFLTIIFDGMFTLLNVFSA